MEIWPALSKQKSQSQTLTMLLDESSFFHVSYQIANIKLHIVIEGVTLDRVWVQFDVGATSVTDFHNWLAQGLVFYKTEDNLQLR